MLSQRGPSYVFLFFPEAKTILLPQVPWPIPLNTPLGFPCLHHAPQLRPCPTKPANPLTRSCPIFFTLTPLPNPPQVALKSHLCTRSPLLHSACTHASHGLKTAGPHYRLKTRFRRERDPTKILFQYYN